MGQPRTRSSRRRQREDSRRTTLTPWGALGRGVLALAFVAAAGWYSFTVTAAAVFAQARPDWVLNLAPYNARANAYAAEKLILGAERPDFDGARAYARKALEREATVIHAWRAIGLAEATEGRGPEAARIFAASQQLSRRDIAVQLWMIEERVRTEDIAGALTHYDIALRTSRSVGEVLLPILASASADPAIARPLARLLEAKPPWARDFMIALARDERSGPATADFIERLPGNVREDQADILQALIATLATKEDHESAYRVYRALSPEPAGALVRNAGFERSNDFPIFEWALAQGYNLRAELDRLSPQDDNDVLQIRAAGSEIGHAARQKLLLGQGRYQISVSTGLISESPPARLSIQLVCADSGPVLLDAPIRPGRSARRIVAGSFRIPAGCPTQWLQINVHAPDGPGETRFWIDDVIVEPSGRGDAA